MNILLIGNGFDLAHGLPTRYMQCIEFFKGFQFAIETNYARGAMHFKDYFANTHLPSPLVEYLREVCRDSADCDKYHSNCELIELLKDNFWFKHFINVQGKVGDNWIDFEKEISRIILLFSTAYSLPESGRIALLITNPPAFDLFEHCRAIPNCDQEKNAIDILHSKLNDFIRCMEIYFSLCLQLVSPKDKLPDIQQIGVIHKVLSFNYTNTFEKIYGSDYNVDYCYIHGKIDYSGRKNNMVLGIDESAELAADPQSLKYIHFKKYYQRIHKATDYNYVDWVSPSTSTWSTLHIFGHSLDVTDKDVLESLIMRPLTYTHIYYHSKEEHGRQIANLVKIIGYNELNELTRGRNRTIKFIEQGQV